MSHPVFRRCAAVTVALLLGIGSAPQLHGHTGPAAEVQALTQQSDAWDKAILRKDQAAIEANMADDFRNIDGDADVADKAQFVAGLMSDKLSIDPYTVEDFDVRIYGDVALLYGRTRMTGHYDGKAFTSHYRYIDIYVRRGGKWRVTSVQITRVREPMAKP
jgi:ketosteroid isomerase-like protein